VRRHGEARPRGQKLEARRAEARVRFFGDGEQLARFAHKL